jgi:hypothetical protein
VRPPAGTYDLSRCFIRPLVGSYIDHRAEPAFEREASLLTWHFRSKRKTPGRALEVVGRCEVAGRIRAWGPKRDPVAPVVNEQVNDHSVAREWSLHAAAQQYVARRDRRDRELHARLDRLGHACFGTVGAAR